MRDVKALTGAAAHTSCWASHWLHADSASHVYYSASQFSATSLLNLDSSSVSPREHLERGTVELSDFQMIGY